MTGEILNQRFLNAEIIMVFSFIFILFLPDVEKNFQLRRFPIQILAEKIQMKKIKLKKIVYESGVIKKGLLYCSITLFFLISWMQLEFSAANNRWTDLMEMDIKYIAVNVLTGCVIYLFIYVILDSLWKSCFAYSILATVISIVNYYVILFHGSPLTIMELRNYRTAMNMLGGYHFEVSEIYKFIVLFFIELILSFLVKYSTKKSGEKGGIKKRVVKDLGVCIIGFFIILCCYLSPKPLMDVSVGFSWRYFYQKAGYLACAVKQAVDSLHYPEMPEGYKEEYVDDIVISRDNKVIGETEYPDIILILNETFYDLSLISDIETDVPYFENINTMKNVVRGYAVAPGLGGSTNSSEYELLTSNSLQLMPGITPFNVIDMKNANSIVTHLKQLGYYTTGEHPYVGTNYNRINVYPNMKFDRYYFVEDFVDRKFYGNRGYATDESVYDNLLLWMKDQNSSPQFNYLLTIQNHGEWDMNEKGLDLVHAINDYGEFDEIVDEFLTCIKMSDSAFKYLTEQLAEYDRKVIVCMVGDHSPDFANKIIGEKYQSESSLLLRSTPFVIWANYDIEDKNIGTISMNYMVPTLLEIAELPLSPYYQYMLNLKEKIPILTSYNVYYDKELKSYQYDLLSDYSKEVNDYFFLEYNNLQKRRRQQLFDVLSE